ncbi:MAG TPA: ABC transporter permease [Vicinamibacterales bacterium]|nr:ABC transporter permease [Vicinamibacterales bacterium]
MTRVAALVRSPAGLRVSSVVVVLAVWELFGRTNPIVASYPSAIWTAFIELGVVEGTLWEAFGVTLHGLVVGFAIAAVLGIVIGFAMGRIRLVDIMLDPYVSALYATPRIALVPLLVLWVGIDFELRVTIVVLSSVFPIIINTYVGTKHVDRELIDVGRAFAASGWQLLRTVVIPGSLPYLFAGLRIGVARALVGIIVAEMTAAVTGTGQLIIQFGRFFQTDRLFVPVIFLGLFSIALAEVVYFLQRRAMPWARVERIR